MPLLLAIPNELLLEISAYLNPGDLGALLRTCRFCAQLLTPRLHRIALEDRNAIPALEWASLRGHLPLVRLLLASGVDVNISQNGRTALYRAIRYNFEEVVQVLLENGADPLIGGPATVGMTALHWAAFFGNEGIVKMLLRAGVEASAGDGFGWTAWHYAKFRKRVAVQKLLE